jgi:NADH:ubiquinone oxidoreductase subunit 3 (subunit A)
MEEKANRAERAYRKANSITELTISADEWIGIAIPFGAMIAADISGYPTRYVVPALMFVLFTAWFMFRIKTQFRRNLAINFVACLALYLLLSITHYIRASVR